MHPRRLPIAIALTALTVLSAAASAAPPDRAVILRGEAVGETRDIDGVSMECFDVELVDPESGMTVGTGSDCLDLASIVEIGDDGGFGIDNTTFFHFLDGTLVSESRTTVQPVEESTDGATHITGEVADVENIVEGTGRYRKAGGRTRLSGIVDMSSFDAENRIGFDCIFVIDFD